MSDPAFFSAFAYSVEKAMASMLGTTCRMSNSSTVDSGRYLSGIVYLSGRATGRVALTFPHATAQRVVAGMLGIDREELTDALLRDGVAEMTNIVAGNAKALLVDTPYAFQISLPRVTQGESLMPGSTGGTRAVSRRFESPLGPLLVAVWLEETNVQEQTN